MPANTSNTGSIVNFQVTFNQPVNNLKIRVVDLDENVNANLSNPEEWLSAITPAPNSVSLISGVNPIFLNGNIVTPDDNASSSNNDASGWLNWSGSISQISFTYNRPFGGLYGLIIDSIYFECSCVDPEVNLGADTTLCEGESLQLDASSSGAGTFLWNTGETTAAINVTQSGIFSVAASNGSCTASDTIQVQFSSLPDVFPDDSTLCPNEQIQLDAFHPDVSSYLWSDGSTQSSLSISQAGTYWLEISDGNCTARDTFEVVAIQYPEELPNMLIRCTPDPVVCSVEADGALSYQWSNGSSNPQITIDTSGDYWVTVDFGNCSFEDTVSVEFLTPPPPLPENSVLCENDTLIINAAFQNVSSYMWQDLSDKPYYEVTEGGIIWVMRTYGPCIQTDTTYIEVIPNPIDTSYIVEACTDRTLLLKTTNEGSYSWNTGSQNPMIEVFTPGSYTLETTNICGISYTGWEVTFHDCDCFFYIPNSFTPNADGNNETFGVISECIFDYFDFQIYNRWGELIFQGSDPLLKWDGTYRDLPCPDGVYTYKFIYRDFIMHSPKEITGHVSLLR